VTNVDLVMAPRHQRVRATDSLDNRERGFAGKCGEIRHYSFGARSWMTPEVQPKSYVDVAFDDGTYGVNIYGTELEVE
jgi:hypothetical protein